MDIELLDKLRVAYPTMSAFALIVTGAMAGWAASWIVHRQQLNNRADVIDSLKAALESKFPVEAALRLAKSPRRTKGMQAGIAIAVFGLLIAATGVFVIYLAINSSANSPPPTKQATPSPHESAPISTAPIPPKFRSPPAVDRFANHVPKTPDQPSSLLRRKFTPKQARLMIEAVGRLNEAVAPLLKLQTASKYFITHPQIANPSQMWFDHIKSGGYDTAINSLINYKKELKGVSDKIDDIMSEYTNDYGADLLIILGEPSFNKLQTAIDSYIAAINELKKLNITLEGKFIEMSLHERMEALASAYRDFSKWIASFIMERSGLAMAELKKDL